MVNLLIIWSCISVSPQYNTMCRKTVEAGITQSNIKDNLLLIEKYYENKIHKVISKDTGVIIVAAYSLIVRQEINVGFTFNPISDTIVIQGKQDRIGVNLGWAF